jgi:transcription elongation factor Elf1
VSGSNLRRVMTCSFCGRQESDEAKTLTWTVAVEHGQRTAYCDECSRTNLRAMEGKLDSEFW